METPPPEPFEPDAFEPDAHEPDAHEPAPEADDGPPLVMERLRRFGWLAVVLVPLMVITLAQTFMSTEWAIIVFIGGLVAITAWIQRENDS